MTPASSYLIQTAADTRFSHIGRRLYSKQRSRRPKAEVIFKPKGKFAACDLCKARSRQRWLILVSLGTQRAHDYTSMKRTSRKDRYRCTPHFWLGQSSSRQRRAPL